MENFKFGQRRILSRVVVMVPSMNIDHFDTPYRSHRVAGPYQPEHTPSPLLARITAGVKRAGMTEEGFVSLTIHRGIHLLEDQTAQEKVEPLHCRPWRAE